MNKYLQEITVQELPHFGRNSASVHILRIDEIHPVVSGNKWFKLRYYLEEALAQKKTRIATFGGAYSNHIVAAAFAAQAAGLKSTGYIRGEKSPHISPTLFQAGEYGMDIVFIDRESYRNKQQIMQRYNNPDTYWIQEGGYGIRGAKGAAQILNFPGSNEYTHIICATGSGTMMAGLMKSAANHQQIIGISVLKNHFSLENEVRWLLNEVENQQSCAFIHGYHFGGYAKHPESLIEFMKELWQTWALPTDIVYTAKMLYGAKDLVAKNYFLPQSKVLIIHSGGLQGNLSLLPNRLPFNCPTEIIFVSNEKYFSNFCFYTWVDYL